ncbi:unnamed protein product [Prorocentrum cordatum]|uniref:Uncharacterized protein n=1 Tax=Prorocentrum cordatum TaxID=2364126 RepID=A0ABN9TGH0_9DINO|nr:unnamed protein product [Polarella glacialis]
MAPVVSQRPLRKLETTQSQSERYSYGPKPVLSRYILKANNSATSELWFKAGRGPHSEARTSNPLEFTWATPHPALRSLGSVATRELHEPSPKHGPSKAPEKEEEEEEA